MSTPPAKKKNSSSSLFMMMMGFVLTMFSSPCVVMMIHDIIMGAENLSGAVGAGSFMAMVTLAGLLLFRMGWKLRNELPDTSLSAAREQAGLNAIREAGGEITVAGLALHSDLSIVEATAFLESLEAQGMAHSFVTTEGAISYRIPHLSGSHKSVDATENVFDFEEQEAPAEAPVEFTHKA